MDCGGLNDWDSTSSCLASICIAQEWVSLRTIRLLHRGITCKLSVTGAIATAFGRRQGKPELRLLPASPPGIGSGLEAYLIAFEVTVALELVEAFFFVAIGNMQAAATSSRQEGFQ